MEEQRRGSVGVKKEGENAGHFIVLLVRWKILDS